MDTALLLTHGADVSTCRARTRRPADRRTADPNRTARAILDELRRRPGHPVVRYVDADGNGAGRSMPLRSGVEVVGMVLPDFGGPDGSPVVVNPAGSPTATGPVLVALDDDDNGAALTAYGLAQSERRGVALRTVYIWTDCRPPDCDHHLVCHRDLWDAERLLTSLIDKHLPVDDATPIERDVLHDGDAVQALLSLSASASLLIVGASSSRPGAGRVLGDTTRELVARTRCPLAVMPHPHRAGMSPSA